MAKEITYGIQATLKNGSVIDSQNIGNIQLDQAGRDVYVATVALTTSFVALSKGNVGTIGTLFITADAANASTIQVSVDGGSTTLLTIPAGKTDALSLGGYTIGDVQIKATTGTGLALVRIWEA